MPQLALVQHAPSVQTPSSPHCESIVQSTHWPAWHMPLEHCESCVHEVHACVVGSHALAFGFVAQSASTRHATQVLLPVSQTLGAGQSAVDSQ